MYVYTYFTLCLKFIQTAEMVASLKCLSSLLLDQINIVKQKNTLGSLKVNTCTYKNTNKQIEKEVQLN